MRLAIFCVALSLVACAGAPKPPSDLEVCAIDIEANVCYRLRIPKNPEGDWEYIGDKPLSALDKSFAVTPEHVLKVKKYIKELKDWAEQRANQ